MAASKGEVDEIFLMISANYVPGWSLWEGVRELVQNWYDGILQSFESSTTLDLETNRLTFEKHDTSDHIRYIATVKSNTERFSAILRKVLARDSSLDINTFEEQFIEEMEIEERNDPLGYIVYDKVNHVLTMINFNTTISKSSLLVGASRKCLHHHTIGQFGEGMKIGALALVRSGHRVVVQTGRQRWEFLIKKHHCFDEEVLTVCITERPGDLTAFPPLPKFIDIKEGDMCTQISSLEEKKWMDFSQKFLFLEKPQDKVETEVGSLLLDVHLAGEMFVKQIWIKNMKNEHLLKGVDIRELLLDRDRRCAANHDQVEHAVNLIWSRAVKRKPELHGLYFNLLSEKESQMCDVKYASYYLEDNESIDLIAKAFFEHHGSDAYPVLDSVTHDTINRLENEFKKRTVYVNQNLHSILQRSYKLTAIEEMLHNKKHSVKPMSDLSEDEMSTLHHGLGIVRLLEPDFPYEKVDLIEDSENEVIMNPRSGHYEVPLWMLHEREVHQRLRPKSCNPASRNQCMCASSCLALQVLKHHTSQVPNPMMRLYGLMNHLATQQTKGAEAFCLHIHKYPPLSSSEKERFSTSLKAKEQELLEKKKDFERVLEEKSQEEKQKLKEMEERLDKAKNENAKLEMELYEVNIRYQEKIQETYKQHETACQKLASHYETTLTRVAKIREDLMKQRVHIDSKCERVISHGFREKQRMAKEKEVRQSRLDWLRDIFLERLEAFKDLYEVSRKTHVSQLFESAWESFTWKVKDLEDTKMLCSTCCQKRRNTYFEPCCHSVVCSECVQKLQQTTQRCPFCKGPFESKRLKLPDETNDSEGPYDNCEEVEDPENMDVLET